MFIEEIDGISLQFETEAEPDVSGSPVIFSPGKIDTGTRAMLSCVSFENDDKVLDLGCGYGVVGIFAAKKIAPENIVMCDILQPAVQLARKNAETNGVRSDISCGIKILCSDGFENISDRDFSLILSNPPYHTDFSVAKRFIECGFAHLRVGGRMVMVTKRLDWYKNKLTSVFGGVKVTEIAGYYVFISEKRKKQRNNTVINAAKNKNTLSRKLKRKINREKA